MQISNHGRNQQHADGGGVVATVDDDGGVRLLDGVGLSALTLLAGGADRRLALASGNHMQYAMKPVICACDSCKERRPNFTFYSVYCRSICLIGMVLACTPFRMTARPMRG